MSIGLCLHVSVGDVSSEGQKEGCEHNFKHATLVDTAFAILWG